MDGRSPPPSSYETATDRPALPPPAPARGATPGAASKPSLPPRLPPRTNTSSMTSPASPEPGIAGGSNNVLNKGAVNRLGAAGVSVPGLGIGKSGASSASPSPPPPHSRQPSAQVNELQNRFSNLKATNSEQDQQQAPAEGTTWAQKQAALKTASSFQKDPSSISMSDAKAAAGTANNFRQRHGEQVTSSMRSANSLNQKYGVANKIGGYAGGGQQQDQGQAGNPAAGGGAMSAVAGLAAKKKPPPPPPKKKPGLGGSATPTPTVVEDEPPPIPMATRPTF